MLSKEELLKRPNYLLTKYQNEIYRQLVDYMQANNLTQKDISKRLGVSGAYVSQILNGNFNFTLKKLIEIGLMVGKVPAIEFVEFNEFWGREKKRTVEKSTISGTQKIQDLVKPIKRVQNRGLKKSNSAPVSIKKKAKL